MDTIGFAFEEFATFPAEMRDYLNGDDPTWKKVLRVVIIVVIILGFLVFAGYP